MGVFCSTYGGEEVYTGIWLRNLRERDHLEETGLDVGIILRWILRKWDVGTWTGSSWLRKGTGGRTCECGNEPSISIKCEEFLV